MPLDRRRERRRYIDVEIDLSNYVDLDDVIESEDLVYLQGCLEDARRCLNRPERSVAEAIMHIERAMREIGRALK